MTKPKTKKSPKRKESTTSKAVARLTGSVRCPCCGGTGKVEKKLLQTYTWKAMGKRSKAKKGSFISVLTWRSVSADSSKPAASGDDET